jgi:hypothetical protein
MACLLIHDALGNAAHQSKIIIDPAVSRRCEALLKSRNQNITNKQKLYSLIERNRRALKEISRERKSWKQKLRTNQIELNKRLKLTLFQIEKEEEQIIRKGCPGVPL